MWHRPQLLDALADSLFVVALGGLLTAAGLALAHLPAFALTDVVVTNELQAVKRAELEEVVQQIPQHAYFDVSPESLRRSLEKLPWVRRADVRRYWPGQLLVTIEEQEAVAVWGEREEKATAGEEWVNSYGEVFSAPPVAEMQKNLAALPVLSGPPGHAAEVLQRYGEFLPQLRSIGRTPVRVALSSRLAWQVRLDDGMRINLGREQQQSQLAQRLTRFVTYYPTIAEANQAAKVAIVDMRYPNGFALRQAAERQAPR
ncbi:MAG: cell division protein FtsQ/DivIB [Betaproteobacteria bacterium]|nr:cell division protein FtsQ/DivIB [Betaproteobacteria bacterium]